MIANTVELGFSAEVLEELVVILMCLHVRIVQCEWQVLAVDKEIIENIGVSAAWWYPIWG
jgi:hypothetical protein